MIRSSNYIAIPPGATIRELLSERGMSQKEFAARMDMSEKHISRLINGEVHLTPDVAVRLEMVLGAPAGFWNNLESMYRETLVKVKAENAMDADKRLARQFPYNEMAKLGWIPYTKNPEERVVNLRKYFEVVELSLLENIKITRIACRRLAVTEKGDLALMAWAQEVKIKAREAETSPINIKGLLAIIPQLRAMTASTQENFCLKLKQMLSEQGIALVFLPHLKGSFLQGASFVDGSKIVIGMTARGKDADKFWFSFFHELGHVVLGHVGKAGGTTQEDEKKADQWAKDILIPNDDFEKLKEEERYSEEEIRTFAKQIGVSPGIIVGRLQNEGYIPYSMFNNLKDHYEILAG